MGWTWTHSVVGICKSIGLVLVLVCGLHYNTSWNIEYVLSEKTILINGITFVNQLSLSIAMNSSQIWTKYSLSTVNKAENQLTVGCLTSVVGRVQNTTGKRLYMAPFNPVLTDLLNSELLLQVYRTSFTRQCIWNTVDSVGYFPSFFFFWTGCVFALLWNVYLY